MTIAACYVSREGVVLGADSTSTFDFTQNHYLNYSQKLFEIGENSTFGVVSWGLGRIRDISYRTFTAHLADDIAHNPPASVQDVAQRWTALLWPEYSTHFAPQMQRAVQLQTIDVTAGRSQAEDEEYQELEEWFTGFCVGGYCPADRVPDAYEISLDVRQSQPTMRQVRRYLPTFWGAPSIIERLMYAADWRLISDILQSGKWAGNAQDLVTLMAKYALHTPELPVREAIDFVHTSIYSTIKALKFSRYEQTCGGPIEIAVITSDRRFRWVRHKRMDEAIREQEIKI
jgi:hypothetical protein